MIFKNVAFFRHHIVISGANSFENRRHVHIVVLLTTFLVLYSLSLFTILALMEIPSLPIIEFCINGKNARKATKLMLLFFGPNLLASIVPVFYDIKTHIYFRNHAIQMGPNAPGIDRPTNIRLNFGESRFTFRSRPSQYG